MWLQSYLRHPLQLGALFPSSSALGSLMVRHINPDTDGRILELGPGTGSFTRALLRRGVPEETLVLVEQSPDFTAFLQNSFPKANVICGNAKNLSAILISLGIEEVDEIVSGIPLNAMGSALRQMICDQAFRILRVGGSFVQASYLPRCSIPNDRIAAHSANKIYCGTALRNIPPGFVWRAEKH
jgi:phosphatidylethanolamine/phosphatidyl-N-methylethanolamine N-methyltransferase